MTPHNHLTAIHGLAALLLVVVAFGTIHMLVLTHDNRFSRAWVSLGF